MNPQTTRPRYVAYQGVPTEQLSEESTAAASTTTASTLLIRHLPEAIPSDTLCRLFSHYGASSVRPFSAGRVRNCVFVDFKSEALASQAHRQLNGLCFLGKVLSVERANKPTESDKNQRGAGQSGKHSSSLTKDSTPNRDLNEGSKLGSFSASEPIAERLGVDYPFPPHLEYAYPPPDGNILTNIVNALIAVPRFYTQVLHLMNKMNIPAPFRMALPTPPLPPSVVVPTPPPPPPLPPPIATKPPTADLSSGESELESSDEEVDGKAHPIGVPRVARPKRKRIKREAIVGPAVDKYVAHEAVGLKPANLVPKEIPMIKKKNPVLQIKIMPKQVQSEQTEIDMEKESTEPDKENLDLRPYATPEELKSGKLPPEEILSLPMFKVMHLDAEKEMMSQCVALLGKFIDVREPNIRYLGLENMTRMLMVSDVQDIIKRHQSQIITSLKDPDISIRRRALDLLYGMCDVSNAKDIVEELLQYLSSADFAMREELSLKAAILAEKFAPDLSWYVDVILQLIDKAGDFVSDDIWFRVVQFVTNNEDLQLYAAVKAREYLDKPAVHETMVKVSAYILGEYSHLLARRPGCSPKEIFSIIHEKLPTVSTSTISILLSTYAKILMHNQPPDAELQNQIWAIFHKYESCIDVEIQQRAVEYFALSRKGADLVDILAEMPKFPERQSALIRKAEDTEADTAEQSATKLRSLHQTSNALVVTDQRPANGMPPVNQLGLVKVPNMSNVDHNSADQGVTEANGTLTVVDPQPLDPSADVLGDLLGPLAIEGPPHVAAQSEHNLVSGAEVAPNAEDALALTPVEEQKNTIQPIGNLAERFNALCLKDSGVLYEDPYIQIGIKAEWRAHQGRLVLFLGNKNIAPLVAVQAVILPPSHLKMELSLVPEVIPPRAQVQCPLEVVNLRPSRDVAVLDFSYNFGTHAVNVKVRLPVVLNKFLQPISVSAEEFFPQWRSLSGPPLKLQDVVRGVRPMSLAEMTNLFNSFRLLVCPGLDPNANNLVASTTFYSESTRAMLCLIRIETDPADRTQLRMTVASGDPTLTLELKEFIKEQLVSIPTISRAPGPATPQQAQPTSAPTAISDPGAMLAGLFQ